MYMHTQTQATGVRESHMKDANALLEFMDLLDEYTKVVDIKR